MRATLSGEGDFDVTADDAWVVEVTTSYSTVIVRAEDGAVVVTINGEEVWREQQRR